MEEGPRAAAGAAPALRGAGRPGALHSSRWRLLRLDPGRAACSAAAIAPSPGEGQCELGEADGAIARGAAASVRSVASGGAGTLRGDADSSRNLQAAFAFSRVGRVYGKGLGCPGFGGANA